MKFIYILTSTQKDFYYEQFFLSLCSFRLHNPDAEVIVLVDQLTKLTLTEKRSGYEKLISEIKVVNLPDKYNQKEASRFIKTSIRNNVSGDFLFIDSDTIIVTTLDSQSFANINVGAVLDTHVSLSDHHLKNEFIHQIKTSCYENQFNSINYFNSGIIYCKDIQDTHDFYNLWHKLWIQSNKHGISVDQPSLNQANFESNNIITELPGVWNCQISHNGLKFLSEAKIIHCFATSLYLFANPYKLASSEILSSIKKTGEISEEVLQLLYNPLSSFEETTRIIAGKYIVDVIDSPSFKLLVYLRDNHNSFYNFLNKIFKKLASVIKKKMDK